MVGPVLPYSIILNHAWASLCMAHYLYCMQGKEARGWEWDNVLPQDRQEEKGKAGDKMNTLKEIIL